MTPAAATDSGSAHVRNRRSGRLALGVAGALAAGFVLLAPWRRLNFDEALALRAGMLELSRADTAPAFVMPWTLLIGALGRTIDDPGLLFATARLVTVLAVLGALLAAFTRSGLSAERLGAAIAVTLIQGAFVSHGFEFRYDAAVLLGVLGLTAALADPEDPRPWLAGVALGWLGLHHVKGLFFAGLLGLWCLLALRRRQGGMIRCAAGIGGVLALWLGLLSALGLSARWLGTLSEFGALSREVTRMPVSGSLGPVVARDLAWWLLVTGGLFATMWQARHGGLRSGERALLIPAAVALLFVVVHPHAWAYMLALPAPFLAGLVALRWPENGLRSRVARGWLAVVALGLMVQAGPLRRSPLAPWRSALAAPAAPVVESLRALRAVALPGERVLDPSGLVYFLPPCTREWYVDGLFAERVEKGTWMTELSAGVPPGCTWVAGTYRLQGVPPAALAGVRNDFRFFPSGVGLRYPDPAGARRSSLEPLAIEAALNNYW